MKRLKLAWERMAYQEDGGFSITRLTMFFSSILAILLIPVGVACKVIFNIVLPDNIYDYAGKMAGIGVLQYTATKIRQGVSEYIATKTPTTTTTDTAVAKEE